MNVEPGPKARILDVYGAFGRQSGGWISIAALITLLGEVGIDSQAVRSAASRMKRSGLLVPQKIGGAAGYALSADAAAILDDGDERIFRAPGDDDDPNWVLALFSVPETERQNRYAIRSRLARLGFGPGPASSWIAPIGVAPETRRMLERTGLDAYVSLWKAEHLGFADVTTIAESAWDLETIESRYRDFIALVDGVRRSNGAADEPDHDRSSFIDYLTVLSAWRPLPFIDPGLPTTVTPSGWPAPQARARFVEVHEALHPAATRHYRAVVAA